MPERLIIFSWNNKLRLITFAKPVEATRHAETRKVLPVGEGSANLSVKHKPSYFDHFMFSDNQESQRPLVFMMLANAVPRCLHSFLPPPPHYSRWAAAAASRSVQRALTLVLVSFNESVTLLNSFGSKGE